MREIHISGGSWETVGSNPSTKIRRDTHDDSVPQDVFDLLEVTIPLCPNLKFVVMEQLGEGLVTPESKSSFQQDFIKMREIIKKYNKKKAVPNDFMPISSIVVDEVPYEIPEFYQQQLELSEILENAKDYEHAKQWLSTSSLANSPWKSENWKPEMLETAMQIAQKWKNGF